MVHNAKQKFHAVSAVMSTLVVGLLIGAIATPDWVKFSNVDSKIQTQGLFKSCASGTCVDNQYPAVPGSIFTNLGCQQDGSAIRDRFNVTAGTLLGAAAITALVIIFQLVHISRIGKLSTPGHVWLFWALVLAFVSSLVGISVFGGSVNSWLNCGSDVCQPYRTTATSCGVGYAYVFCVVGCGLILLSALGVICYTKFPYIMFPTNDVILMVAGTEILAVVLIGIGIASTEWLVVVQFYQSWGLFQTCGAWACSAIDAPTALNSRTKAGDTTTCTVSGPSITGRLNGAAALLIVAAAITAVLALLFAIAKLRISTKLFITNTKKRITIGFISLALALQVIAFIIATNFFDSYYFCGDGFCEYYLGFCRPGIAFGLALGAISVTASLLLIHIMEFNDCCCFQERFASGRQTFSIWKVLQGTKDGSDKEPTASRAPTEPTQAAPANTQPTENVLQLPAGQWDYDSVSGFYWSEELYLFYDPGTQQFYDPNKDEWFVQDRRTIAAGITTPRSVAERAGSLNRGGSERRANQTEMGRIDSPRKGATPNRV